MTAAGPDRIWSEQILKSSSSSNAALVCVLDNNPSPRGSTCEIQVSAGWKAKPFSRPDTILDYARHYNPQAAIRDFSGLRRHRSEVVGRLKQTSRATAIVFPVKVHRGNAARDVLGKNELLNSIEKQYARRLGGTGFERGVVFASRKLNHGCRY